MIDDPWVAAKPDDVPVRLRPDDWLDEPTSHPILRGLARNPSAPHDVLLRLLGTNAAGGLRLHPNLPQASVEAMANHPSAQVRAALATNPRVDPTIRRNLVDDPDKRVDHRAREALGLPPPDRVLRKPLDPLLKMYHRRLLTDAEFQGELIEIIGRDRRILLSAARHPERHVRIALAAVLHWFLGSVGTDVVRQLGYDETPEIRAAVAQYLAGLEEEVDVADRSYNGYTYRALLTDRRLSPATIRHVLTKDGGLGGLASLARNRYTPPEVIARMFDDLPAMVRRSLAGNVHLDVEHEALEVRRSLALRADLTPTQLTDLAADPDVSVRTAVSVHPGLTEEQRAAIDIDLSHAPWDGHYSNVWDEASLWMPPAPPRPPLPESTRCAASVNPLLRRLAARDPRLPAGTVAALAADPDPQVRLLLAHNHPAAPPELLLRVFHEDREDRRLRLLAMPNFPTEGLAGFADDPDPALRRLVPRDPAVDSAVVERLTSDPDAAVRRAAAACPRLPAERRLTLLDHPDLAEAAAANPTHPPEAMRSLVEHIMTGDLADPNHRTPDNR